MLNILHLCTLFWLLAIPNLAQTIDNGKPGQSNLYTALVFLTETRELKGTRQPDRIPVHYLRWAAACPAQSSAEQMFEQNVSLDRKSLFVKSIAEEGFSGDLCAKPVQISAAYHSEENKLQFGYEVYYEEKFAGFQSPSYNTMKSIQNYISIFSPVKNIIRQIAFENLELKNDNDEKTKLGFVWIDRLSLQHDFKYWTPNLIQYQMLRNFPRRLRECDDYHLAEDYFESANFDSFYTKENEQKKFKDVDTSSFIIKCEPEIEQCLTKWQLIPTNQISYNSDAPSTCSNLTTVPIWVNLTQRLLDNLTIFLQATIQVLKDNLDITILMDNPLLLPRTDDKPPQPIYMHSEANKIPIIGTIYYLIRYKIPYCDERDSICHHAIIIVIHNDPKFDQNDRICPQQDDLCAKLKWNWIRDEDLGPDDRSMYDNFYCCEPVDPLITKFVSSQEKTVEFASLDLGDLPTYDKAGKKTARNLIDSILNVIENLKKGKNENSGQDDLSPKSNPEDLGENQSSGDNSNTHKIPKTDSAERQKNKDPE